MKFNNINDLYSAFTGGSDTFLMQEHITVAGVSYTLTPSLSVDTTDLFGGKGNSTATYSIDNRDSKSKDLLLPEGFVLHWEADNHSQLTPTNVTILQSNSTLTENTPNYEKPDNVIGSTTDVKFTSLPGSSTIKAKIDTGATICSLHTDNYRINQQENTITFVSPPLSSNELTVPLVDQQAVTSADGGSEYRPVIEVNIRIGNKLVNNVKINLNDRSHMEYPVLIGKNALEQGKFLIDPRINEQLNHEPKEIASDANDIRRVYNILKESNISFADIIHLMQDDIDNNGD